VSHQAEHVTPSPYPARSPVCVCARARACVRVTGASGDDERTVDGVRALNAWWSESTKRMVE
jgi:hypothetical protein